MDIVDLSTWNFANYHSGNKLYFIYSTTVAKCKTFNGPMNDFKFVNFQTLLDNGIEIDVAFGEFSCLKSTHVGPDKNTLKQTLVMEDLRHQVVDYISTHPNISCMVMIIQFSRLKFFGGRVYVNNTIAATKLFINKDIEEIRDFKEYAPITYSIYVMRHHPVQEQLGQVSYIPSKMNLLLNILCTGGIRNHSWNHKNVEDRYSWYYFACSNCKTKVLKKDGSVSHPNDLVLDVNKDMFVCTKPRCQDKKFEAQPSFILKVRVQGMSGVVTLTMFERDVKRFVKMTTVQLFENQQKSDNPCGFPNELYSLIELKIAFKIAVKLQTFSPYSRYYNFAKWTDDMDIISELEKADYEESVSLSNIESASQFKVNLKIQILLSMTALLCLIIWMALAQVLSPNAVKHDLNLYQKKQNAT
ncbi:hypothetical protein LXL04_020450 [Taraxacum kok-saghyz]